jgi:ABC-type antimicrobial peptide transport system permease subunit
LINVVRTPGRAIVAIAGLAVGVAALTILLAVTIGFKGAVVGSVLGEAVSIQVRSADVVAVITLVALSTIGVCDTLYLNIRERAAELAVLRSSGWADADVRRLVLLEGLWLGATGALLGATGGLLVSSLFTGGVHGGSILTAAAAASVGVLVVLLGSAVPASLMKRLSTAPLLAAE